RSGEMAKSTQLADNEVFRAYATYAAIVLLKMMLMSLITAYYRMTRKVGIWEYSCSEDAEKIMRLEVVYSTECNTVKNFSSFSRGHLNDLENIVPFVGIGLLYALSGPELSTALLHFRIFTGARILHTFAYLIPLPQPGRGLSWAVGYAVTLSMAYKVLKTVLLL
ncbi:Microsomal glutathione S-transferase 1, partial [Manacus vitellinus]